MERLSPLWCALSLLGGYDLSADNGDGGGTEQHSTGVEAVHQERAVLVYELQRLQREADARRALGVAEAAEAQPPGEAGSRARP